MSVYIKDPASVVDYTIDWGAGYLAGESLASSEFSVLPVEAAGLAVDSSSNDASSANVVLSGGVPGHVYRVINHITTTGGRTDERSLILRISER